MESEYIKQYDGGYYLAAVRVSLDSIVYAFNRGESPETIQENFPVLKLSQIYGAIAYYLDHKAEIDKYIEDSEREFEACGIPMSEANPVLWEKIQKFRANMAESHS